MNNGLATHSDKVQRINNEIIKINESGLNFNNESQLYDLERNIEINPDNLRISSPPKCSFFSRNKNDGQYKIIREKQISSIFKTVNDLSKNKKPNNQFLSVSIQSNIDNETISEGFSIFWTLSNRIDKDKVKKLSKEREKANIQNSHYNENESSTVLPTPQINPEKSPTKENKTTSDENLQMKRKRRSKKEIELQNQLQNPNLTRSNSQIHSLTQNPNFTQSNSQIHPLTQNPNFPKQSLNYMNYGQIQNQPSSVLFSSTLSAPSIPPIMRVSSSPTFLRPNINSNLISTSISTQKIQKLEQNINQQSNMQQNMLFQQQQQQNLHPQNQTNFMYQQSLNYQKNQTSSQLKQQENSGYQKHLQQPKIQQNLHSTSLNITNQSSQNSKKRMSPNSKSANKISKYQSTNHQPIKHSNINLHPKPILINQNSQLQIEDLNQQGCIIEIKKVEAIEQKEKPMNKKDLQSSIMAAREELIKKGMPPIPTTGVYERQQKAKRHVRRRKPNDFLLDNFENETNSSNEISEESFFPIIPIKFNQT